MDDNSAKPADKPASPLQPIKSSMLHAYGYDAASKTLVVQYALDGPRYEHPGVPQELVDGLAQAESAGRYFGANIRRQFPGTKV